MTDTALGDHYKLPEGYIADLFALLSFVAFWCKLRKYGKKMGALKIEVMVFLIALQWELSMTKSSIKRGTWIVRMAPKNR